MSYNYITKYTSPNDSGERTKYGVTKPEFIVIHHWGKRGQSFLAVVKYLCTLWSRRSDKRKSSAHYVAQAGLVACIIDPDRVAWHSGNWDVNTKAIGIECRPEATDEDYETVAELIRELRDEYGALPLKPHRQFQATACPGVWDLTRLDRMAREMTPEPKPQKPVRTTKGMVRWIMRMIGGSVTGENLYSKVRRIDANVKQIRRLVEELHEQHGGKS